MKKCLLLLILCCLLPAAALAQAKYAPYDMTLSLCYRTLTPAQQEVCDIIYDAVWQSEEDISLPAGTKYADVTAAMQLLCSDMPELCAMQPSWTVSYYESAPDEATAVHVAYTMPASTQGTVLAQARAIVSGCPATDIYGTELYLHDYLCDNIVYGGSDQVAHSAYGALAQGCCVCDGYSKSFALLMRLAGIPCSVVTGSGYSSDTGRYEPHSWNIAALGGDYALVDVTWDDQNEARVYYYFNIPDSWMTRDHTADAPYMLPECRTTAWNWHAVNGGFVPTGSGRDAVQQAFWALAHGQSKVELRFESPAEYAEAMAVDDNWQHYNDSVSVDDGLYGNMSWRFNEQQYCVTFEVR